MRVFGFGVAKRLGKWLFVVMGMLALLVALATCTTTPRLASGVVKRTARVQCGEVAVKVDFYWPEVKVGAERIPLVVVAHGFTRSKRYMAGWGADLAARGMAAAVLTQPFLARHEANARAIEELVKLGRAGKWPGLKQGGGKVALVGYSMGGLTTLLAAAALDEPVAAWVGLDPVDFEGRGQRVAGRVQAAGLALLAEPAAFNRDGNALTMLRPYGGPLQVLKVTGASHMDAEYPTDRLGQLACGWVKPERQGQFRRLALDFLSAVLGTEGPAEARLEAGVERVTLER
jgi:pimeloyl-ACP methyl ester carboxylesterase